MFQKKVSFLVKALHWCLHLHLDRSKFDLSSWVIPSIPMVKLKDCSFNIWRSHRKQTKHSGDIAISFTVIFMILVASKLILLYLVRIRKIMNMIETYWASFETLIFTEMWRILVEEGIKSGKVTLEYHEKIRNCKLYCFFGLRKVFLMLSSLCLGYVQILLNRSKKIIV